MPRIYEQVTEQLFAQLEEVSPGQRVWSDYDPEDSRHVLALMTQVMARSRRPVSVTIVTEDNTTDTLQMGFLPQVDDDGPRHFLRLSSPDGTHTAELSELVALMLSIAGSDDTSDPRTIA